MGVTGEHPFYTPEGWKAIEPPRHTGQLKTGDKIRTTSGGYVAVKAFERRDGEIKVYNLKNGEADDRNYYVNGLLVKAVSSKPSVSFRLSTKK